MNNVSFTDSKSFTQTLFTARIQPIPEQLSIEPAKGGALSKFSVNEIDPISQTSFKELIEDQFSQKLDYFIVIDEDENGLIHFNDGFSYLKNYCSYGNHQNPLSRGEIKDFTIYRLNVFDSTQTLRYFCSKKNIDSNNGYQKHIEAHFPDYQTNLRPNAFCDLAQEYRNGRSVFGQNKKEAYAWYKRAALTFENANAYACLSILKKQGLGTKMSQNKSMTYLRKAAEKTTDGRVCYLFAQSLENKPEIHPNIPQTWYLKAINLGCKEAEGKLDPSLFIKV